MDPLLEKPLSVGAIKTGILHWIIGPRAANGAGAKGDKG
jgi:hypothetical protein